MRRRAKSGTFPTGSRERGVGIIAFVFRAAIDGDNIAVFDLSRAGNSVHDLFINGNAAGRGKIGIARTPLNAGTASASRIIFSAIRSISIVATPSWIMVFR